MTGNKLPSVIRFEQAIKAKDYGLACSELVDILSRLDRNLGGISGIELDMPDQLADLEKEKIIYFCTRMAVAITCLFEDPDLEVLEEGAIRFLTLQRWIGMIFASSPYVNADHILRAYNQNKSPTDINMIDLEVSLPALIKFSILYLPESNVLLNLDKSWSISPDLTVMLCFALQSPRFLGTSEAFAKRAAILQWLPEKLVQIENLDKLPYSILHDVYMHCSYDIAINKHNIKKALNEVIRRYLLLVGWEDREVKLIGHKNNKPVMVVLLEHFHAFHSIYRTHSTSLRAAREYFHIIGLGTKGVVDKAGQEVFDEFHFLPDDEVLFSRLLFIKDICDKNNAAIFYMPSIGMDLTTILASNTRVAPIQAIALGHPATTHSDFIEYVVVEDDYVGLEECFSEKLLRLPKDALPYIPSSLAPKNIVYKLREEPETINIGIASTTMKLNPYFLEALRAIQHRANVKIHFHFAVAQPNGITYPYVERFIKSYLGNDATVYPALPYEQYLYMLQDCDMMLNPFPFGNTNGIIDMVMLGLVGVCKTGAEVHEHIDEGLFKRLGLPEWLITHTVDEYIECAIRLAENHKERLAIRRYIIENNRLQTLFSGDPTLMGKVFLAKVQEWTETK